MAKLTYANEKGHSLTFGDKAPLLVTKIEGLGSPQNIVYRQKSPYQDGTTATHSTLDERELNIEGVILDGDKERYRQHLLKIFNPKLNGYLIYENGNIKKKINCTVVQAPYFPSNMQESFQLFLINLICPNPFWEDLSSIKEEVAIWRGSFEFPLEILESGIEIGYREPSLIVNIENKGDVPCGIKVEFKALGTVANPSIFNINTREFIKIDKIMTGGEILTITTHFGNKRVESNINGVITNAFNFIDLESDFIQLYPGDNLFRYDAEEGLENLEVSIYYTPQYLGV